MVIDASVAVKWIHQDEQGYEQAYRLLRRHFEQSERIIVIDFFYYEVANTLIRKIDSPINVVRRSLKKLFAADFQIYHPDEQDVLESARIAKQYRVTVYGALYAVVALRLKTILITADERFVAAVKMRHVKLLSKYEI